MNGHTITARRPSYKIYPGPLVFSVFGALWLAFSLYVLHSAGIRSWFTQFMLFMTAVLLYFAVVTTARYLTYRVTASVSDDAVVLNGREFRFDRIDSVALAEKARLGQWAQRIATRRTLTVAAGGRRHSFAWLAPGGDPVAPVLQVLIHRVADEARRRPLRGNGWSLDHGTLRTKHDETPLGAITAAARFDDAVRLWRHGEAVPFLAAPIESPNALVLLHIAEETARKAPATPALTPAADRTHLGRLLFVRKPSGVVNMISAAGLGFFATAVAFWPVSKWLPRYNEAIWIAGGAVTVILILRAALAFFTRYRFHELGIAATYLAGRRELRYADIERMTWSEKRQFTHEIYSGTTLDATLVPAGGRALRIDIYRRRTTDGDMEPVRDTIGHQIAGRLEKRLQSEGRAPWTRNVTFLRDGVELKPGVIVRYDEPVRLRFDDNRLHFYRNDPRKPIGIIGCSDENFFPGYFLYLRLTEGTG